MALMADPEQGFGYAVLRSLALAAEQAGFEAFLRSDHLASLLGRGARPTTEAWATVAGLARETTRIRLGTLVSPVTFRDPGLLAKTVATVSEMSNGRVELGLGAGWHEDEHAQFGIEFPPMSVRLAMLEETLAVLDGLWNRADGWSFKGMHWTIRESAFQPKPTPESGLAVHLILGGMGGKRLLRLAARYADEFNMSWKVLDRAADIAADLRAACREVGRARPPVLSAITGFIVGASTSEVLERRERLLAEIDGDPQTTAWFTERESKWLIGTAAEVVQQIEALRDTGIERLILQDFLPWDTEMVHLLGTAVLPRVRQGT